VGYEEKLVRKSGRVGGEVGSRTYWGRGKWEIQGSAGILEKRH